VKLFERLASWAEVTGRVWANYWLLIIATCLIFGSVLLKWIQFPFSRNLHGIQFPFLHGLGLAPHISLFSFGVLGAAILICGIVVSRLSLLALGVAGAILLTLFALAPADLAFVEPAILQRLVEEDQVTPLVKSFSRTYLPANYGASETIPKQLALYSTWGRLVAAWSFLRLGWYLFGVGSLLLAVYALQRLRGQRLPLLLLLVGLPLAALFIVLAPAMIGEHYFTRGSVAKAEGLNSEAIGLFRKAMRWDRWHAQDIDLYATIGELQRLGRLAEGTPEEQIDQAMTLRKLGRYEDAIFQLEMAAQSGSALSLTARREVARVHVSFGLALYQAGGIGSALIQWQQALAEDPTQLYALVYLGRGYFDLGQYDSALQTSTELAKIVKDHNSLLGNAYSLAGDCYAKLGRNSDARHYYNLSLAADPIVNYWALTGLVGE
jgi:tetratricopeptide (TPR) repeat protein